MLKHIKTSMSSGKVSVTPSSADPTGHSHNGSSGEENGPPTTNAKDPPPTSATSKDSDEQVQLPQRFVVKYLGHRVTSSLWGIKYTRDPVDSMVAEAKDMLANNRDKSLPLLKLEVTADGVLLDSMPQNLNADCPTGKFLIESISYGVQDLVFTRVFAMIVVKPPIPLEAIDGAAAISSAEPKIRLSSYGKSVTPGQPFPFQCHAFVCDSKQTTRKLTYSLATAFQQFSKQVAAGKVSFTKASKFAIDLRPAEEIEADLLDSEA